MKVEVIKIIVAKLWSILIALFLQEMIYSSQFCSLDCFSFCREPCSSCAALFSAVEWPYSSAETLLAENN